MKLKEIYLKNKEELVDLSFEFIQFLFWSRKKNSFFVKVSTPRLISHFIQYSLNYIYDLGNILKKIEIYRPSKCLLKEGTIRNRSKITLEF